MSWGVPSLHMQTDGMDVDDDGIKETKEEKKKPRTREMLGTYLLYRCKESA
jgi:hypothetical protein